MENIIQNYKNVLLSWGNFQGRATRSEFWYFVLANAVVMVGLGLVGGTLFGSFGGFLLKLYCLAMIVPIVALCIRRLHDIGKSAWWGLLWFIPIVNLVLLYFALLDSDADNVFGPNPKQITAS